MQTSLVSWTDRTFSFDTPAGLYPELLERLRGTPLRAADLVAGIGEADLRRRDGEGWSIQENLAHLADLDATLWSERLRQYQEGADRLVAADMSNRHTEARAHNERGIQDVLAELASERAKIMATLDAAEPAFFARAAHHPRLDVEMRVADLLFFQAEHDDHHLARSRELARKWRSGG